MNSKHTLTWFVIAVVLFMFIFIYEYFQRLTVPESLEILPGLRPLTVTSVQVFPNNAPEISVERTNDTWFLTQPVVYPAQKTAVDGLVDAVQKLKAAMHISPAEAAQTHNVNAEYGFNAPEVSLVIQSGDDRREVLVGNKTAPGDQVFLRVVGEDGVFVTDVGWLQHIPQSANDWRDSALVNLGNNCDSITLTNGAKIVELHLNPVNQLWQMTRPLVARANSDFIAGALQGLRNSRVTQFVSDNPNADLTAFGLQPASLDLWLGYASNAVAAIHIGKDSTNDATQVFARREGWNTIVTTPKQPLSAWFGTVNDFRDPYLLELTAPVAEIEMVGPGTNRYVLQRLATSAWQIAGEKFPVDAASVQSFIQWLANMRVSEFVKDVVTPADLPAYGLAPSARQIILRSAIGSTNAVIAQLLFGSVHTNEVFVRRADENFIYAITPEDFTRLPEGPPWQFRDHSIWNFSENDITQITVRQNGKTLQMVHNGPNKWSLATGSQGVINPPAIEEVAHDLGTMAAVAWWARGVDNPSDYGLKPGNLSITATLKNGQAYTVDFGTPLSGQTSLAAVTLDGEQWVFIFPPALYQLIMSYLAIPPGVT
ncbi:MAG TPA: DUF4340 domain-containing protein [Candidatus Acidoferrum sp.]|jgi:hypothetical protein|nr:DUF4340 domain-containing protein [Candidatus Acidoferrum sp.]